jgi:23S rRNA (pseudouridine1915-N3)-methyltransferase
MILSPYGRCLKRHDETTISIQMKIKIITVGHKMPDWVTQGFSEFQKRLSNQHELILHEIPLLKRSKNADIKRLMLKEAESMQAAIPDNSFVIALDRKGSQWSSEQLANQFHVWQTQSAHLCILIGGPEGFDQTIFASVHAKWSLSHLTLPHPIVRIVLAEQLYRAQSILNNHPYHR